MKAKTRIIVLHRKYTVGRCTLTVGRTMAKEFCWHGFKRLNPAICKGLRKGQSRMLKRTQLNNGFKLEIYV